MTKIIARHALEEPVTELLNDDDVPLIYEDDGQEEMGDADIHTRTGDILFYGLQAHLSAHPEYRVFCNLNLFYSKNDREAYASPDIMAVKPRKQLPKDLRSYRIGKDGQAPVVAMEVLSERTFQEGDLTVKPLIYARLRIPEYILVDVTGCYLPVKLLLKRRLSNRAWSDERDPDGGVTSNLGFRLVLEPDGQVRVIDTKTGKGYVRPDEAQSALDALHDLQAEIDRLRNSATKRSSHTRRRKKP
jgi:Uma2 family endonuclease